ncbi:DUF4232 domain-containing protein [Streptomyces griseoviridis]|uniref:DUF4232 domain-containing protein n=2 Tax=Streptomyces TaxID=1883 RepID=A0A3S9ZEE9_STRGD|nr:MULTISPECIES: DUF4232 domain-containing protein [Streptomyces]AZS85877.1 DUF4232 domain-containing protein [Streptomyces griseoviridis]MDH6702628.1 hypothetical protein [Streptomyces sp. MAA16]MDT0476960.1 DUF4232 domain-containing protein [Streptomyces sp. DSM 41014]QCN87263.1 hypothetical protein DDJ31_21840 [Streptomyces griseoviridis]
MRATRLTVAALAAALLLTACDANDSGDDSKSEVGGACALTGVGVQVDASAAPAAGDTGNVTVTITNHGAECTVTGFPAVHLKAGGTTADVPEDKAAKPQKVTLAKDATASFTLTYVRGATGGSGSLAVRNGEFSLPGATAKHTFPWSYGDVALKGGAKTPDASVTPFQQAGD